MRWLVVVATLAVATTARAEVVVPAPAFEVNVLWPLFPGGISEFKFLLPVVGAGQRDWHGELLLGVYSDYAWRVVRDDDAGKVSYYAAKIGYRQFLVSGLHVEAVTNLGWRHEENNPHDGTDLDAFAGRLFLWGGWQKDLSSTIYMNGRVGGHMHLFRTDDFERFEREFGAAVDVNLGIRF